MVQVKIMQNPDDPLCPRISAGGVKALGYYLVYRGHPKIILEILKRITEELEKDIASGVKHPPSEEE